MVRRKSRSRSRGREDGYQSDEAVTVRPFKPVKRGKGRAAKSPKKTAALYYKEGEEVMARWPGSRLYYTARIQLVRPEQGEYDVEYENGVIFTVTSKDVYKQGGSNKKSNRRSKSDTAAEENLVGEADMEAEVTEDEDITSKLVKVSSSSKKISNGSFKEPALVTRASNGSKPARVSSSSRSSRAGPVTDVFSDDEELLSVSQRPSVSSVISQGKKVSSSSKLSKLNRVSFSSTINRLLDNVFVNKIHSNGLIEENENVEGSNVENGIAGNQETASKVSEISNKPDGDNDNKDHNMSGSSLRLDEFSEDELDESKNEKFAVTSSVEIPGRSGKLDWLVSLFFMALGPTILVTLHNVCTADLTNLSLPTLSLNPVDYFDKEAFIIVTSFMMVLRFCEFVCIGKNVEGHRMNGFQTLLICLLTIPGLLAHDISLSVVFTKYFYLMTSSILLSSLLSIAAYALSFISPGELSKTGTSGNPVSDIYHGRSLNPTFTGCNLKLQTFRFSMIGLALLNLALVTQSLLESDARPNMAVIVTASLQVLYAMDAMFYEKYYFNSTDYLSSAYGWSLISSYLTFPFLPTLATRYIIHAQPETSMAVLVGSSLLNLAGYVIYRSSETQRCELATNPTNPELVDLETVEGVQGRKLIVSGWWSLVRHPTYLGEVLIQWSWVLPLASSLGLRFLTPYYLPLITSLMLILRCVQTNNTNRRKFGAAWEEYSRRVKSNMIPFVF